MRTRMFSDLSMPLVAVTEHPGQAAAAGYVAYSLPSRSWIRPARRWRCTTMPTWCSKRYGDKALEESAAHVDELAAEDDFNGEAVWRRITDAVRQLANHTPAGPLH